MRAVMYGFSALAIGAIPALADDSAGSVNEINPPHFGWIETIDVPEAQSEQTSEDAHQDQPEIEHSPWRFIVNVHGGVVEADFVDGDDLVMAGGRLALQYRWVGVELSGATTLSTVETQAFNDDTEITTTSETSVDSAGAYLTLGNDQGNGWFVLARAGAGYNDVQIDIEHDGVADDRQRQQVDVSYGASLGYRTAYGLGLSVDYTVLGEDLTHAGGSLQWTF